MRLAYPNESWLRVLALQAGEIIKRNFALGMKKEWKGDDTPITATDEAVNRLVCLSFARDFSHIHLISEEGGIEVPDADFIALCDPVDGTIPFSLGAPGFTFCLAIVKEGSPLIAVIYDPLMERMWIAKKGKGSFLNGRPIKVSAKGTLGRSNAAIVWWNGAPYNLHRVCNELVEKGVHWMNLNSIAYFGGLVAAGEFEASIFPGNKAWETAAMQLVVEEAGGRSTDMFGNRHTFDRSNSINGHVISNGHLHDELLAIVTDCQ